VQGIGPVELIVGLAILVLIVVLIIYFVSRRWRTLRSEELGERT
jgi:hypothetical protein